MLDYLDKIRRNYQIAPAVLAAALSACMTQTVPLNSERIQQKFGSYGIDVLASASDLRRSNLYSIENGAKVCRTYALVRFSEDLDESIASLHSLVMSGRSLGRTFKSDGWTVHKQTLHIGAFELNATPPSELSSLMHLNGNSQLAHHVYKLVLNKGQRSIDYATISEAHHPDYLSQSDLNNIYSQGARDDFSEHSVEQLVQMMTNSPD